MVSKYWDKQNHAIRNYGLALGIGLPIVLATNAPLMGLGHINPFIFLALIIPGIIGTIYLMRRFSNLLIRIVHQTYRETDLHILKVLKENEIQYQRTGKQGELTYSFPEHALTMIIKPHKLPDIEEEFKERLSELTKSSKKTEQKQPLASTVTLQTLNQENKVFVEQLTSLIDSVVNQYTPAKPIKG